MSWMNRTAVLVTAVLVVSLSACGDQHSDDRVTEQPPSPEPGTSASRDDIVWRVFDGPGFTSPEIAFNMLPAITVYGDGRFVVPLPDQRQLVLTRTSAFEEGQLPAAVLAALEERIAAAHVFDQSLHELGNPGIADAGTTTVTGLSPEGNQVEVSAYALGMGGGTMISDGQRDLRERISALIHDTQAMLPDHGDHAYQPELLAVIGFSGDGAVDPTTEQQRWPGPSTDVMFADQQNGYGCYVVKSQDVPTIYDAALDNDGLFWTDGRGGIFEALVKVVLPDQQACPL